MTLSEGHLLCWSMLIHKQFQFQGSHQLQEEIPQQELAYFVCLFVCSFVCLFVYVSVHLFVKSENCTAGEQGKGHVSFTRSLRQFQKCANFEILSNTMQFFLSTLSSLKKRTKSRRLPHVHTIPVNFWFGMKTRLFLLPA